MKLFDTAPEDLTLEERARYARHLVIPGVGVEGQRKLKAASVLVVGNGGLGSPIALYLAAAGVGRIGLVDYDVVDASNLQRQIIHDTYHLGQPKALSAKERLLAINPLIRVEAHVQAFTSESAASLAEGYDIVVDGSDNFPTRYLINDLCVLSGKPYVYGAVFRFEGQVSVFDARRGPCYRCLFPEMPKPGSIPTTAQAGIFGVLPGIVGAIQATEAIKLILGIGTPLIGSLLLVDALTMRFETVQIRKNPQCAVCGEQPRVRSLQDSEAALSNR